MFPGLQFIVGGQMEIVGGADDLKTEIVWGSDDLKIEIAWGSDDLKIEIAWVDDDFSQGRILRTDRPVERDDMLREKLTDLSGNKI